MANDASPAGTLSLPPDTDYADRVQNPLAGRATRRRLVGHPITFGLITVIALSVLLGWLGFHSYQARQSQIAREEFLQTARQAAVNLTTIDWQHADADVRRIMDGATGQFYDEFAQRSQPFVEVVTQAKSVSAGTVTEAGLESQSGDQAQALVAVSVKTSNPAGAAQIPRAWRMRISVHKVDGQLKVSRVEFVA